MIRSSEDIIIRTVSRVVVPFILLFALYVIMHGHHSPGGGFQGGVILGAGLVLLLITYGLKETRRHISEKSVTIFRSLGLLIYSGIGLLCVILLGNYLDYGKVSSLVHVAQAEARSLGILGIEIGVGLTVMAVMFSIFFDISTGGELPEDEEE